MKTRPIGSLNVSVIGLGCNNFGGRLDEAATIEVVHAALDSGVTLLDTADIYGGTKSETYMGAALKGRRDKAVVATKFGMKVDDERQGARPEYVAQACDDSLRRLGIETIDLYQLHTPDASTPIADTLGALNRLIEAGKVREIGCSNFSVEQLREAEKAAGSGARFVCVQNQYNLFHREPEDGVLAESERQGMGFLPFFPLASGLLSGKYRKDRPAPEGTRITKSERREELLSEARMDVVERLAGYAEAHGHSLLELAFGWLLAHEPVSSVIAGATKPEQVHANVEAAGWELTEGQVAEIDRLTVLETTPVG